MMTRFLRSSLLVGALLFSSGCDGFGDFVDDPLGDFELQLQITDAEVDLGTALRVAVGPDQPAAVRSTIPSNLNVQTINQLQSISLDPSFFTFTAPAGRSGPGAPSGTIGVALFVDGYPVPGAAPLVITITDGAVTGLSTTRIAQATSTLTPAEITALVNRIPEGQRPTLADYQSLTITEVIEQIRASLSGSSIPYTLAVEILSSTNPDAPLTGDLQLSRLNVSAIVTP